MITPLRVFEYGLAVAGDITILAASIALLAVAVILIQGLRRRGTPKP